MKKIGIYVHIPFCVKKCLYCDFISFENKLNEQEMYIKKLKKEIEVRLSEIDKNKYSIDTIYFGGGTPSIIKKEYIGEILRTIMDNCNLDKGIEITLEVNPGTTDKDKLKYYKNLGINRLSIGLQSTENRLLKLLGRIHTYEEFLEVYTNARKLGFENINVDLIIGVPTQTVDDINKAMRNVIQLNPEHISTYSLIVEENTELEKKINSGELILPNEEDERRMYWYIKDKLEEKGYKHYEISNFAKSGKESKHNINCWNQEEYLGFGLAAHSYFNNQRYSNTENLEEYMNEKELYKIRQINEIQTKEDKAKEYMLLGLRKIDGVSISEFKKRFLGNPIYLYKNEINKLNQEGLIQVDLDNIKLTSKGIDLANLVWEKFV